KKQLYVGEVSEVEVQVYWQEGRMNYPQLPVDPGFTVGKWLRPVESRVNISNQTWGLVQFKQPITAVKAGLLTLGPATVTIMARRAVQITAPPLTVQVLPVPDQNVPPTFSGAVGNFSLNFSATP